MDWRERNYYLIDYSMARQPNWKSISKSIKLFPPYNHFKEYPGYDPRIMSSGGLLWASQMLSCRKSDAVCVEAAMKNMEDNYSNHLNFKKLTPIMCGQ